MTAAIVHCNVCVKNDVEPFKVPWDKYGAALMREHFREHHPEVKFPI